MREIATSLSTEDTEQAWDLFQQKWTDMDEKKFVDYFKAKYSAKMFCRGDVPAGFPIVGTLAL